MNNSYKEQLIAKIREASKELGRDPKSALIVSDNLMSALRMQITLREAGLENISFKILETGQTISADKINRILDDYGNQISESD